VTSGLSTRTLPGWPCEGAIQNMARPDPSLPSFLRPQLLTTELRPWQSGGCDIVMPPISQTRKIFHDDPDVKHSSTLVTAWEANWRTPSGSTTQHGRQPWQPSAPYLFRFSGTKACSPLTSLVVSATSNCGVGHPPNGRRLALLRERARSLNERRGRDKGRDDPSNSVAGSKHPQQSSHAGVQQKSFGQVLRSAWVVMAQHGAMFCFSDLTTTRTTEQVPSPQSLTAVQLRRDFPVTPESWNLAWLFASCQLTRGSTWPPSASAGELCSFPVGFRATATLRLRS
jgi:hypothetical protein